MKIYLETRDRVWSWYRIYEMEIISRQNSERELINIDISDAQQHNKEQKREKKKRAKDMLNLGNNKKKEKKMKFKKEFGRDFLFRF